MLAFGWAVFLHLIFLSTDDLSSLDVQACAKPFLVVSLLFSMVICVCSPDVPICSLISVANVFFYRLFDSVFPLVFQTAHLHEHQKISWSLQLKTVSRGFFIFR